MNLQSEIIRLPSKGPATLESDLAPHTSWAEMGAREHFVQFYEQDAFLVDSVAGFIGAGLRQGEAAIVIATPQHRQALDLRLKEEDLDTSQLRDRAQFISLDAAETLACFMIDGQPDATLFDRVVGNLVRRTTQDQRPLRAFGEMVALLCAAGNPAGAMRLEDLWNDLAKTSAFSLFCAYPMKVLRGDTNGAPLMHVCSQHSRVIPAESYAAHRNASERLRAITLLQQKAASLEAEVAERRRAECSVREQQTRLAMAVAIARLGIWELDLLSNQLSCSDQCKAHFGLRPDEPLTYDRWLELIHPDDRESVRNTLRNAIAISGDHCSEYRIVDAGGRVRWISSLGRCFHNGDHRMVGVTLDVTDSKLNAETLERTVAERTARLKEALGELESFSFSISHDMRAPLRSMQGFAAILMEDCADELSPEARACLERINASAERMDRLIQDVLTFSRVARADFILEPVDLARLLTGIIESYPHLQPPKADISIEGKLPIVLGNTAGLTQCLSNLLGNAVKFVAPETHPRLRVWSEPAGPSAIRLYIEDNGIGIPPESHDKIFEIFHRLSKKYDGTGIGLAIVRKAIDRMGGKVGVLANPTAGSTFWLELRLPSKPD